MNMASSSAASCSTSLLRCCFSRSFSSFPAAQAAGSRHQTPRGTNARLPAAGRPKRDRTTYGIPPLHKSLKDGTLSRYEYEGKQWPDLEKIWDAEDTLSRPEVAAKEAEKAKKILLEQRQNQPKRHPLWAFFHEKSRADVEKDFDIKIAAGKAKQGEDIIKGSAANSLAFALETPDNIAARSGRPWHADELRRKSFNDLHTLWYRLLVERNVLYTQKEEARRSGVDIFSYTYLQEQLHRCRKSMARIKYILSERRRAIKEAQGILEADKKLKATQTGESGSSASTRALFEEADTAPSATTNA